MASDGFFFLGVLLFFFLLWFWSGGPTRPISYAGPYITPITDVGTKQEAYGSTSGWFGSSSWKAPAGNSSAGSGAGSVGSDSPQSAYVSIVGVSSGASEKEEYVTIQVAQNAPSPVSITGWRLRSAATNKSATVPSGAELARTGIATEGPITLRPGDQAIIVTGDSPIGTSFRENRCVGYLAQNQSFVPYLWSSCPSAASEFERYYEGNKLRDDTCYNYVQSLPLCKAATNAPRDLTSECDDFVDDYLDYGGCVAAHRSEEGFYGNTFRVYLERNTKLWKTSREAVKLLDSEGRIVDTYTY